MRLREREKERQREGERDEAEREGGCCVFGPLLFLAVGLGCHSTLRSSFPSGL